MNNTPILSDYDPVSLSSERTMRGGDPATLGRIDHYDLLRKLGGGGFGVVYLARDTASGVEVALKTLHPLLKQNAEEMDSLREKFALVSRLSHANIATALVLHPVRDVIFFDETARRELKLSPGDSVMVMRYAPGVTLSKWRRQFPGGVVPRDLALEVGRQVAAALDYAHSERIVHRDVKPSNVMVETVAEPRPLDQGQGATRSSSAPALRVRILDFGLAAEIRSSMSRVSTESGDTSGTRPYMAPEQWLGRNQDGRTDQYALACVLYELLSGAPPFAGVFETGDPVIMRTAVVSDPPEEIEGLDAAANAALQRALSKAPKERFPSCGALVAALAGQGGASPPGEPPKLLRVETAPSEARRPRRVGVALAAVVLLAAAAGVVFRAQGPTEVPSQSESEPDDNPPATRHDGAETTPPRPVPAPIVTAKEVRTVALPGGLTMRFRGCPKGSFTMGSPDWEDGRDDDETPHRVTLSKGFWMGETEVTQGAWKALMNGETVIDLARKALQDDTEYQLGGKKQTLRDFMGLSRDSDPANQCADPDDKAPVYNVSWAEAARFCAILNERERKAGRLPDGYEYRLPTEAEWEYACRAGTTTSLPNGKEISIVGENNAPALDDIAWYGGNSSVGFSGRGWNTDGWTDKQYPGGTAAPRHVATKAANNWGLYDMIGNVWEWCYDWYGSYPNWEVTDPSGASSGVRRVSRGGSWNLVARSCRSACRGRFEPGIRAHSLGFRVVLAPVLER